MTKHTPGPWTEVVSMANHRILEIKGSEGEAICSTHIWGQDHFPEVSANAKLIAAAPDLLRALKDAANPKTRRRHWLQEARYAIAKAEDTTP